MTLKEIIKFRHSVKAYNPTKKINNEEFKEVLEFIRWAPNSVNFQLARNIVVDRESELNKKIANKEVMTFNDKITKDASKMQFFIIPNDNVEITPESPLIREGVKYMAFQRSGKPVSEITEEELDAMVPNFYKTIETAEWVGSFAKWAARQAYIQLGFAAIGASHKKISTTPMEGINHKAINELFRSEGLITKDEQVIVAMAYGYRIDETSFNPSERKPLSWYTKEVK